jgi:nicotinamidase-related amidase
MQLDEAGTKTAVILIDEQQGFSFTSNSGSSLALPLLSNQSAVLQLVDQLQHATACFIELNPANKETWKPTNGRLLNLVSSVKRKRISKQFFSAFDNTNLRSTLEQEGINDLIVMGHMANHCVKQTIFGGARKPTGSNPEDRIIRQGAINYDYSVFSSQTIVSGDIEWIEHPLVTLFAHI